MADDVDLSHLADPPFTPPTGRLSRSASSICGLGRFADLERCAHVTCVSGLLCTPLLSTLSPVPSIASAGAAWSKENVPVSELLYS